jgi:hypothetical protein
VLFFLKGDGASKDPEDASLIPRRLHNYMEALREIRKYKEAM